MRPFTPSIQHPCEVHPVGNPVACGATVVVVVVVVTGRVVVVVVPITGEVVVEILEVVVDEDTGGAAPRM